MYVWFSALSALNSLLIPPHSRFYTVCPSGILPCLKSLLMPPHSRFYSQPAPLISNPDCSQSAELTLVATLLFVRSLSLFAFNTRTHVRYPNLSAFSTPLTACLHSVPPTLPVCIPYPISRPVCIPYPISRPVCIQYPPHPHPSPPRPHYPQKKRNVPIGVAVCRTWRQKGSASEFRSAQLQVKRTTLRKHAGSMRLCPLT